MGRLGQSATWQTDYGGTPRKEYSKGRNEGRENFFSCGFQGANRWRGKILGAAQGIFGVLSLRSMRTQESGGF